MRTGRTSPYPFEFLLDLFVFCVVLIKVIDQAVEDALQGLVEL